MSEFGHDYGGDGNAFFFDVWGAGPFVISVAGKDFRFEDSDRFGPALINRNGELKAEPYPPERSPFWRAHRIWVRQGRRVEDKINCVWDEPKPTIAKRINSRNIEVTENGEEDGKLIILDANGNPEKERYITP